MSFRVGDPNLQLDLWGVFDLLGENPAQVSAPELSSMPTLEPSLVAALEPLPAQLLDALRIHSVADYGRCAAGGLIELERQANLILRGVASNRPKLTDERWQAALDALPYYYVRGLSINAIN